MRIHTMNSFHISRLLSEGQPSEYRTPVLLRKHTYGYGDEENWCTVPLGWVEARGEV
jgi:hypothetical protein